MRTRIIRQTLAVVFCVAAAAPVAAQSFQTRTVNGNGRNIFELRLGGTTLLPNAPNQGLIVTAVTSGPTSGTTSLIAATFDGRTLFDAAVPPPTFTSVVATGSVFSLGGGCQHGTQTVFPFINNARPQLLRHNAGVFSVVTPSIANSDQYDSADCVTSPDGQASYFMFTNRTDSTLEFYRENAAGFQALPAATTLANVGTPFSGNLRPAFAFEPLSVSQRLRLVYGYNEATTTTMRTSVLNVGSATHIEPCPLLVTPRPSAFTRPRESALVFMGTFGGGVTVSAADFDNDGVVDIFTSTPSCQNVRTAAGSSNGGGAFNWTGFGAAVDNSNGSANVLWGDYYYVNNSATYPVSASSPGPFPGRGGPFAACPAEDTESGAETVSVATGTNQSQLQFARGHRNTDRIFKSQMSRSELMTFCVRAFLN
jgi:hypothetical protein